MRRRLIPVNVVIAALLFILLSLNPVRNNPPQAVVDRGVLIYNKECRSCHNSSEGDDLLTENSTLSKTKMVMGPRQPLIKFMLHGTQLNTATHSKLSMPAYNNLSDQQLSDVLTYIRSSFGNNAKPVTPADVKKARLSNKK